VWGKRELHKFRWGNLKRQILNFRVRPIVEDDTKLLQKKGHGACPRKYTRNALL